MMPHRLGLDYVAAPRRPLWIGFSVLIVALAVAGNMVLRHRDARHELAALDAAQGLLNVERRPRAAPKPKERLYEEAKSLDAALRLLTLPWAPMIEAVEADSTVEDALLHMQHHAH